MARGPFFEDALTRYEEVQEANRRLLVSLDELRSRADNFLTVAASTATVFAAFANRSHADLTPMDRYHGPTEANGGPTEIDAPALDPAVFEAPRGSTTGTAATSRPGTPPRDVVRREGTEYGRCPGETVVAQAITSPNRANATVGLPFAFTVTTTGIAYPYITVKNDLPVNLRFHDNGDGTADISGMPRKAGIFHFKIRARFGRSTGRYVVTQGFTLNVVATS